MGLAFPPGHRLDLHPRTLGQIPHGESGPGGAVAGKILGVDLVHGAKVGDIRQQDGDLHHVREGVARLLQDSADVFQALLGLALDILGGEFAR